MRKVLDSPSEEDEFSKVYLRHQPDFGRVRPENTAYSRSRPLLLAPLGTVAQLFASSVLRIIADVMWEYAYVHYVSDEGECGAIILGG